MLTGQIHDRQKRNVQVQRTIKIYDIHLNPLLSNNLVCHYSILSNKKNLTVLSQASWTHHFHLNMTTLTNRRAITANNACCPQHYNHLFIFLPTTQNNTKKLTLTVIKSALSYNTIPTARTWAWAHIINWWHVVCTKRKDTEKNKKLKRKRSVLAGVKWIQICW